MVFNSKFSIRSLLSLDDDDNSIIEVVDPENNSIDITEDENSSIIDITEDDNNNIIDITENENKSAQLSPTTSNKSENDEQRPPYTYSALILMAIRSSPEKRLKATEICDWIAEKFPYYQKNKTVWYGTIRHNLSLNSFFIRAPKSSGNQGRGNYWTLDPSAEDVKIGGTCGRLMKREKRTRLRDCTPYSPQISEKSNIPVSTEVHNTQKNEEYHVNQQVYSQRPQHLANSIYLPTPGEMQSIWNQVYQYQMMMNNSSMY